MSVTAIARPLWTPTLRPSGREAVRLNRDSSSIISMEGAHRVLGTLEPGHDRVANRLDNGAGSLTDDPVQDLEVLANQEIRVHITNAFIQRGRLLQIGEQKSHV
ncbi:hypothetical protein ABIB95_008998 [Bradyrhizobium sp. LA2.1]